MALNPTSSHGGGTFNGGAITEGLTITDVDAAESALFVTAGNLIDAGQTLEVSGQGFVEARGIGGNRGSFDVADDSTGQYVRMDTFTGIQLHGIGLLTQVITSGALPTVAPVSGTAFQPTTARDVHLVVPFTGDGTNNAATLLIQLSPDNVTFSTLDTLSVAAALNLTGALNVPVSLHVPAGWYVKLTAAHGAIGTATYY